MGLWLGMIATVATGKQGDHREGPEQAFAPGLVTAVHAVLPVTAAGVLKRSSNPY
ncbi:hypothetical protein D3C71_2189440 [compost metagenome]